MKKHLFFLALAVGFMAVLTGCQTIEEKTRIKPEPISDFLDHHELLVAQKPSFPFHYFYLKEDAGTYKNIYIAPVDTTYLRKNKNWAAVDEKMAQTIGSDIQKLADFMQNAYKNEFLMAKGNKLNVVESPNLPDTLILESAIIKIVPTKAEVVILGTAANLILPGISAIAGQIATGTITIECRIRDAKTKKIIAMYANTEQDQHAILNIAGMQWYTSAENNIRKQANYTARIFSGADYSTTRRRLIKIIEF